MSTTAGDATIKIQLDTSGMAAQLARGMAKELRDLADALDGCAERDEADE